MIYIAATLGYQAVGLDLSETAVHNANESGNLQLAMKCYASDTLFSRRLLLRNQTAKVAVSFQMANFFDFDPEDSTLYDIIYDFT